MGIRFSQRIESEHLGPNPNPGVQRLLTGLSERRRPRWDSTPQASLLRYFYNDFGTHFVELGVVGKPNVGKSTLFAAATLAPVQIANYPFTTIEANRGVAFVRKACPHKELGRPCKPNNAPCERGTRLIPVELLDVAGLVPKAHEGRGLGNKFLDDLRQASAFIHVIDATGGTDFEGNPVKPGTHDPLEDVRFLEEELAHWIRGILARDLDKVARRAELEETPMERVLHERLAGLGITENQIHTALLEAGLDSRPSRWTVDDVLRLSRRILLRGKPMLGAGNKADIAPPAGIERPDE